MKVPLLLWIQEIDLGFAKVAPVLQKKEINFKIKINPIVFNIITYNNTVVLVKIV